MVENIDVSLIENFRIVCYFIDARSLEKKEKNENITETTNICFQLQYIHTYIHSLLWWCVRNFLLRGNQLFPALPSTARFISRFIKHSVFPFSSNSAGVRKRKRERGREKFDLITNRATDLFINIDRATTFLFTEILVHVNSTCIIIYDEHMIRRSIWNIMKCNFEIVVVTLNFWY